MDKTLDNLLETLKTIFNFDIVRRLFFLAGITLSVVIGVSLYQWIQEPLYRPLAYQMSDQNFSSVIDTLEKANIKYKINEANGTVSVPAADINNAKLKLAAAGLTKDDGFSYAFLNDQNKLGSSQFLENARYLRALEADLARTISAIQGISGAKVHIAIPQHTIFADENAKTTASIIINVKPGYEGDKEKIRAIIQLVAASVPELDPTNVAITDQYGHYLSSLANANSMINQEQLSYQNTMQQYYEKRIASLITPIVGENKASINVNTVIDFTEQQEAKEEFDPNETTVRSEQTISENSTAPNASGVPGALSNQPPTSEADPGVPPSGQTRTESVKNYEVTKSMRYTKTASPKIKAISVAIVLDDELVYDDKTKKVTAKPLAQEKIDKITELVKSTIGFNKKRGDRVTVINSGFIAKKIEDLPSIPLWEQLWFWDLVKRGAGISLGFIFLIIIYRKIASEFNPKQRRAKANEPPEMLQFVTPEMLQLKDEQIKVLKQLVSNDPNKVASIIKKWVTK